MNRDTLTTLYDRLTKLVEKLPGGVQKPILRELEPIRNVFLSQRTARIMLVGSGSKSVPELLNSLGSVSVETGESTQGWRSYRIIGSSARGEISILDAREGTPAATVEGALAACLPDLALYLNGPGTPSGLEEAAERIAASGSETPLVSIACGDDSLRVRLAALLRSDRRFSLRKYAMCEAGNPTESVEVICSMLPDSSRLEFARVMNARRAQAQIASSLLKSFAAVCGVIGLQPIPLADMPVLTSLQTLMVGLIVYVSGKSVNVRLITEFLGALGLNIGAGIVFRESARAIIKIVPFWGNAVSGFVAGAGTYAVGRAAISYFIEETPITETRKLFHRLLPGWDAFKRRRLPELKKTSREEPPSLPKS